MASRLALISVVALTVAAAAPLSAQANPPPQHDEMSRRVTTLLAGITLTPEQRARVDSLVADTRSQMPAVAPGTRPDSATATRIQELLMRQDSLIRGVLTSEQKLVFDRNAAPLRTARRP
jgi:Spy/CpxP family protein refolding chaperone